MTLENVEAYALAPTFKTFVSDADAVGLAAPVIAPASWSVFDTDAATLAAVLMEAASC